MQLLKKLTQTPAVSGREDRMRQVVLEETQGLFDETHIDPLGSLICVRRPRSSGKGQPLKIMLAAHMDQIGFLVRHIDDRGFLRVQNVGGFDTRNLFARLVKVCTREGDLSGVMNPSGKPIHIASDEERKKVPEVHDLAIDLGLPADQVKQKVRVGDMVVIDVPFHEVGESFVAQAMDNRVACWIAIEAMRQLDARDAQHACEIHCVFTVQEEVGLRGAMTAAYSVQPDIGIGIDTTLCVDTLGVPEDQRVTEQGQGAALTIMDAASIGDMDLIEAFERLAQQHDIPVQRSILPRGGTDTAGIQRARHGVRSFTLSCPTRYIHTVTEMVHRRDLEACRDVLAAYLAEADSVPPREG